MGSTGLKNRIFLSVFVLFALVPAMAPASVLHSTSISPYEGRYRPEFPGLVRLFVHTPRLLSEQGASSLSSCRLNTLPARAFATVADYLGRVGSVWIAGAAIVACIVIAAGWGGVRFWIARSHRGRVLEGERRYRRLIEGVNDGFLEADTAGTILFVNRRMAQLLACETEEIVGSKFDELVAAGSLDEYRNQERSRRTGASGLYELQLQRKDGSSIWVIVSSSAHLDESGQFLGSFATFTDITERREMVLRLKESEERFRTLIEDFPGAIFVTDEEAKVVEFNRAAEELTGIPRDWVIGKPVWELREHMTFLGEVASASGADVRAQVLEAVETGQGKLLYRQLEGTLVHTDGSQRRFRQIIFPIKTGKGFRLGGLGVDTTADVRLEEALRESQQQLLQAQRMEAVGRLAGGIAHDFNNILTAIMGFASILSTRLASEPELLQYVEDIVTSSRRAAHLTQDLLTFGRRTKMSPTVVDLREVVRRHRQLLPDVLGQDISLKLKLRGLAMVEIDPLELDQIIMNLATNARDAMPGGGVITIELTTERVQSPPPLAGMAQGNYAHLSFADTGSGMDGSVRAQMFEPFFTTKETGKGAGLGLSIVWSIAEQYGGAVGVESEVGEGTVVHIYLPLAGSRAPDDEQAVELSPPPGSTGILLVEDDAALRERMRAILVGEGYGVFVARDGEEALRRLTVAKDTVRLVLLDAVTPRKRGPEIREAIRDVRPDVRVVYMSGYPSELLGHEKRSASEDMVILKPFTASQLTEVVREILSK